MMYVHTPIRLNLVHRNSHNQLSSFSPQSSYISTSPVMPKVILAKSGPPLLKVVPIADYIFVSQKWSYAFSYSVTGKEFASFKL